jgi:hypothetical protein
MHRRHRGIGENGPVSSVGKKPGRQRVGIDAVARPGLRHGPGHLFDPALGSAIGDAVGEGAARLQRGEIDDPAPALLPHRRNERLGKKERHREIEAMVRSQPSGVTWSAGWRRLSPAALTRMSGGPKGSADLAAIAAMRAIHGPNRRPGAVDRRLGTPLVKRFGAPRNADDGRRPGRGRSPRPAKTRACTGDAARPGPSGPNRGPCQIS